ncbi:MAG: 3-deoxy-manno-octulosonate cytidylyltransferase [Cyanobacteria bacterium PR.023]|nr:3-deoxy-manno-octulosonate cytidylyltransferase [Cyanobacteria bacterium PR.023]
MKSIIVIPARYDSSRFPGKPLVKISGITMLERTWRIAKQSLADRVVIATDDSRIEDHAKSFGAEVVRTSHDCTNGTERTFEAVSQLDNPGDIIVNLQGDAVLTPPWILSDVIKAMKADPSVRIATPAVKISLAEYKDLAAQKAAGIVGGTLVVFNKHLDAMYFSKSPIPFLRTLPEGEPPLYRHIGLYAYTHSALKEYLALPPGDLEKIEGLEQLRALENGIDIRVVLVDYKGRTHGSVDSPTDVPRVQEIIAAQGELFELAPN